MCSEGAATVSALLSLAHFPSQGKPLPAHALQDGNEISLTGCSFDSNRASNFGGAIHSKGNLLSSSCAFSNNKAGLGGAVALMGGTWAGFKDYSFIKNSVVRVGGARARSGSSGCMQGMRTAWEGSALPGSYVLMLLLLSGLLHTLL